jgi:hypothetical protein
MVFWRHDIVQLKTHLLSFRVCAQIRTLVSGARELDARLHNLTADEEAGLLSLLPYLMKLARKRIGVTLKVGQARPGWAGWPAENNRQMQFVPHRRISVW